MCLEIPFTSVRSPRCTLFVCNEYNKKKNRHVKDICVIC